MTATIQSSLTVAQLEKLIATARKDMRKASEQRAALGPECSRSRITSANAKYARNAEYLERLERQLEAVEGASHD